MCVISIYLTICLSSYLFYYIFIYRSIYLFIYLCVYLFRFCNSSCVTLSQENNVFVLKRCVSDGYKTYITWEGNLYNYVLIGRMLHNQPRIAIKPEHVVMM